MRTLHKLVTFGTHAMKGEVVRFSLRKCEPSKTSPVDILSKQQLSKLRTVLIHAGRNVPYWRRVFRESGFVPSLFSDLRQLEQLPILTPQIIQSRQSEMIAEGFKRNNLVSLKTGGSTGRPFELLIDRPSLEKQMSINIRSFSRAGITASTRLAKILPYGRSHSVVNALVPFSGRVFLDATGADDQEMESWYAVLKRHRIEAIYGHASCVYHFSRYLQWFGYRLPDLRRICVTGDWLSPQMRLVMSSVFKCPIIYMYGRTETFRLACECVRSSLHQDLDAAVLEFVDDERVFPNKRILLTTLHNTAMPLIRYDLGDVGIPSKERCRCGSPLPIISIEPSKYDRFFELPDGNHVHTSVFTKSIYRLPDLEAFQIRPHRGGRVDYLVVPRKGREEQAKRSLETAARACEDSLKGRVHIELQFVDEIPASRGRGHKPVVVFDDY